ncbi:NUDIX domain-containing protein [Pullulanibacillus camelliae]|uniref:NUDIX domain-containing protein n=1 Tax=Pullulanibacillus camelliae TaxID=1707096 RepID=UPI001E626753|nr:NUDIX domain-containing protein [Pullulanibacillus camelliae]
MFPGGGIKAGEMPEEAAMREAYEALGMRVKLERCLTTVAYQGTQYFFGAKRQAGLWGYGRWSRIYGPS